MKRWQKLITIISFPLFFFACGGSNSGNGTTTKNLGTFQPAQNCDEIRSYVQQYANRSKENPDQVVFVEPVRGAPNTPTPTDGGGTDGAEAPQEGSNDGGSSVTQSDIAYPDRARGLLYTFDQSQNLRIFKVSPSSEVELLTSRTLDFFPAELISVNANSKNFLVVFGNVGFGTIFPEPIPFAEDDVVEGPNLEEPKSVIVILDVTQPNQPVELKRETSPGSFLEARALNDNGSVVWVTQRYLPIYLDQPEDSWIIPEKTTATSQGSSTTSVASCNDTVLYQNNSIDSTYAPYALTSTNISLVELAVADFPITTQVLFSPAWRTLVAANANHLFLAQNLNVNLDTTTELYQFDLHSDSSVLNLSASTAVPGNIPNQFFIDEKDGAVRVFHHQQNNGGICLACGVAEPGDGVTFLASETVKAQSTLETGNYLSTYRQEGGKLGLLDREGPFESDEVPYSARFSGELGCIITFLQIDPLTCFDVADPASIKKLGELEIAGVSFHLESVGEGLMLGIGQGGQTGTIVANLFDISNPNQPTLADQLLLSPNGEYAYTSVFYDYRALGKEESSSSFAVPFTSDSGTTIALFSVDQGNKKLVSNGKITKPNSFDSYDNYQRGFFFNDTLAALSYQELEVFLRNNLSKIFTSAL